VSGGDLELFVLGTSQSVASAEDRARLRVDLEEAYDALDTVVGRGLLDEAVPLFTCGRLEVYAVSRRPERALRILRQLLARRSGVPAAHIAARSYVHRDKDAARHLFRVASGLDSVVHGEAQIIGQVREALEHPRTRETIGPLLHRLFQNALAAGKRVRTETAIGRGAVSLAGAALALLKKHVGGFEPLTAVVLGAGDTGVLTARILRKEGLTRLTVVNRTLAKAEKVARELGGGAATLDDMGALARLIADADIVVGAVGERDDLVTPGLLGDVLAAGPDRDRWFLDLAHPRNFDPELATLSGVHLMDLDNVFEGVEAARKARAAEIPRAEALVAEDVSAFMKWVRMRESAAVLKAVRQHVLEMARAEAERHARGRSEAEREEMLSLARSLAHSLLYFPTLALREADPAQVEGRRLLDSATSLFGVAQPAGAGEVE
jgi:glutamyl-tRNA reductase